MNALGVVVADTTPLNYLIIIGRVEILASLFVEILIPQAVLDELRVRRQLHLPPDDN